jgi:hypothetical protein
VSEYLPSLVEEGERLLATVEAVEDGGLFVRTTFGSTWVSARRVALLVTDRRLIEVALDFRGRRATGRVRSLPWQLAASPSVRTDRLQLGPRQVWHLLAPLGNEAVDAMTQGGGSADPGGAAAGTRPWQQQAPNRARASPTTATNASLTGPG